MGLFDDLDDLLKDSEGIDKAFTEIETKTPKTESPVAASHQSKKLGSESRGGGRVIAPEMAEFYDFVPSHRQSKFPDTKRCYYIEEPKKHGAIMAMSDDEFWGHFHDLVPHVIFSEPPYSIFGPDGNHYTPVTAVLQWRFNHYVNTAYESEAVRIIGLSKKLAEFFRNQEAAGYIDVIRQHIKTGKEKHG